MSSGEALGWMAAIGSMLAFGSFGVPIKSDAANSVDVDPLVFQSYKSFMCFATSWLVLLFGVPFSYTPWGIVSCIFWVPGGVATVFAIRNAGLAIAIGVGSSSIVLVSFVWGIFVFQEDIHSQFWASAAVAMMIAGISGMSFYSSPKVQGTAEQTQQLGDSTSGSQFVSLPSTDENENATTTSSSGNNAPSRRPSQRRAPEFEGIDLQTLNPSHFEAPPPPPTEEGAETPEQFQDEEPSSSPRHHDPQEVLFVLGGRPLTRRQVGIAGAVFNGVWGGSIMVPMKWCHGKTSGTGYLISFGIGAALVTTSLWVFRYLYNVVRCNGSWNQAYRALPSFHLSVMWRAGGTSGLLWSIGNFFSILSVYYLGEGVGYSVVQAGMLVSGLWGIFYFHEIQGLETIAKWIASASITVCGIILLSYEHHKS